MMKQPHLLTISILVIIGFFYADADFKCDKRSVPCGCGLNNVEMSPYLNYNQEAVPHSWPMLVSIRFDCHHSGQAMTHCCTGTILSESYVLTSASCFDKMNRSSILSDNVFVLAGIHNSSEKQYRTFRMVDQIYIHSDWIKHSNTFLNDIAIIHISEPFDFVIDGFILPTCRPSRLNSSTYHINYPVDDSFLAIVGWNSLETPTLRQTAIYSMNHKYPVCATYIKNVEVQFCAHSFRDAYNSNCLTCTCISFTMILIFR